MHGVAINVAECYATHETDMAETGVGRTFAKIYILVTLRALLFAGVLNGCCDTATSTEEVYPEAGLEGPDSVKGAIAAHPHRDDFLVEPGGSAEEDRFDSPKSRENGKLPMYWALRGVEPSLDQRGEAAPMQTTRRDVRGVRCKAT